MNQSFIVLFKLYMIYGLDMIMIVGSSKREKTELLKWYKNIWILHGIKAIKGSIVDEKTWKICIMLLETVKYLLGSKFKIASLTSTFCINWFYLIEWRSLWSSSFILEFQNSGGLLRSLKSLKNDHLRELLLKDDMQVPGCCTDAVL